MFDFCVCVFFFCFVSHLLCVSVSGLNSYFVFTRTITYYLQLFPILFQWSYQFGIVLWWTFPFVTWMNAGIQSQSRTTTGYSLLHMNSCRGKVWQRWKEWTATTSNAKDEMERKRNLSKGIIRTKRPQHLLNYCFLMMAVFSKLVLTFRRTINKFITMVLQTERTCVVGSCSS